MSDISLQYQIPVSFVSKRLRSFEITGVRCTNVGVHTINRIDLAVAIYQRLLLRIESSLCTGLIKSNRPLFQLHFFVVCILGKYFIFAKILDKMTLFQYILKLITCHASFRSSDTKQWHTMWIRKSCFKCVTGNISITYNPGLKCDGQGTPNITKSLIWKSLIVSYMLPLLLNWIFPFQPWKIFGADIKKMDLWNIVLYIRVSSKSSQMHNWAPIIMVTWNRVPTLDAASVSPHRFKN